MAVRGHLENRKNCNIAKTIWPILLKFCTITHISGGGSEKVAIKYKLNLFVEGEGVKI